jgi:hypothetical protein
VYTELLARLLPVVEQLLEYHSARGDAQTCAVLVRTLRPVAPNLASAARVRRWTYAYIELLQRLQLFDLAAYRRRAHGPRGSAKVDLVTAGTLA